MHDSPPLFWRPSVGGPAFSGEAAASLCARFREPLTLVSEGARVGAGLGGQATLDTTDAWPILGWLPPIHPEHLGDRSFLDAHGLRFPYVAGEMANGIATARLVLAMADVGMLGFFGAAGLSLSRVEAAIDEISASATGRSWGINLIYSPHEPETEAALVELFLARDVRTVCASAYMDLTLPVVRLAASGLRQDSQGAIHRKTAIFAKVSRPEVARHFLSPAPAAMLAALVGSGQITQEEAQLAAHVPVAEDITAEADSGGHTDRQPLGALLPILLGLRDQICADCDYDRPVRVGAAGGLGTPESIAAAFAAGAAYVLTGSINQSAVESGLSEAGRRLLARAALGDVSMAPAADMFELGVTVQVLRRGSLFAQRAARLYDVYSAHDDMDQIPASERAKLEREIFRAPLDQIWEETRAFFLTRNPAEVALADADGKRRMALVFRWYLGLSSRWAISGEPSRQADYQIWCGPAMAAFNAWVQGSFLAEPESRQVGQIALNLMEGAAQCARAQQLRAAGIRLPSSAFHFTPRPLF